VTPALLERGAVCDGLSNYAIVQSKSRTIAEVGHYGTSDKGQKQTLAVAVANLAFRP